MHLNSTYDIKTKSNNKLTGNRQTDRLRDEKERDAGRRLSIKGAELRQRDKMSKILGQKTQKSRTKRQ